MGPPPTTPVTPSCVSACTGVTFLRQRPSTPPRVSVGVSPIRVQRTPTRTFVSRGLSPVPFEHLLPPDIAAFLASTQMQTTQASLVHTPTHLADQDAISLTSSESDSENIRTRPALASRTRARSPEIVAETQVMIDPLVRRRLFFYMYVYAHSIIPDGPNVGQGSPAEA
jgi:hypothetical protein